MERNVARPPRGNIFAVPVWCLFRFLRFIYSAKPSLLQNLHRYTNIESSDSGTKGCHIPFIPRFYTDYATACVRSCVAVGRVETYLVSRGKPINRSFDEVFLSVRTANFYPGSRETPKADRSAQKVRILLGAKP